jgi:hypothetical protein
MSVVFAETEFDTDLSSLNRSPIMGLGRQIPLDEGFSTALARSQHAINILPAC